MAERVFVIGDVHGHVDRLEALLKQAGFLNKKGERIKTEEKVIQVGDLAHNGYDQSAEKDAACWENAAEKNWIDEVIWGNHDYALVNSKHVFRGFRSANPSLLRSMEKLLEEDRLHFATEASGFLITHAGLARHHQQIEELSGSSVSDLAKTLNESKENDPVIDQISYFRGAGLNDVGGVLWRHHPEENLAYGIKQIFGHTSIGNRTADPFPQRDDDGNWNIDLGTRSNGCLGGVFLPEEDPLRIRIENGRVL